MKERGKGAEQRFADERIERAAIKQAREFCGKLAGLFGDERWRERMSVYRREPERFAKEVLGSEWWDRQREVGQALADHRRVAVRSANGVGKTYLAADLALWFLFSFQPSIVLTTAPTRRQVENLLWREIRRRFFGAKVKLPGKVARTRIEMRPEWFAMGLATDQPDRFQGFHAQDLLIIFDEASGIPEEIWEASEGVAVGKNNKILAIGNPLRATGRFYELFRSSTAWTKVAISALEHPNVSSARTVIPGAVTAESVAERVREWCEEAHSDTSVPRAACFQWRGRLYVPGDLFRARVLGEFPHTSEDALIPLAWIEAAMERKLPTIGRKVAAVDVARFGADSTVIGMRVGPVVTRLDVLRGADTMEVTGRIVRLAYEERPERISIDSIGLGAGVADRLRELGIAGIVPVNVSLKAYDSERFANRRAELYWGLRERFRTGEIAIPRDEEVRAELAGIRYGHTSRGQIKIESKDEMKRRGMSSPDRADMLAMLFDGAGDWIGSGTPSAPAAAIPPSPAALLREEMRVW